MQDELLSPGSLLRSARETKNMSVDEVAEQLRMTKQRILRLENDEYKLIGDHVYVRGYLRLYAQLVGLLPEDIIEVFNRLDLSDERERHPSIAIPSGRLGPRHRFWVYLSTAGLVILLTILVVVWWHGHSGVSDVSASRDATSPDKLAAQVYQGLSQSNTMGSDKT